MDPTSQKAARIATALNGLGHIAMGHSLDEIRHAGGDAKLRKLFHEDATLVLDLVEREVSVQSKAVPNPQECIAALSRFRDMVQSVDFDDAVSMSTLKAHARKALEAFMGAPLPEKLSE